MRHTLIVFVFLCLSRCAWCQTKQPSLKADFEYGRRLIVAGYSHPGMWLGLSFYPQSGTPWHQLIPLSSSGTFTKRMTIWNRFLGGRYEVALWDRKVYATECHNPNCLYCAKYGYHLEGRSNLIYGSFLVPTFSPY